MFQYLQYLVILGAAVHLIGIYFYIKNIIKGNTKPNKITWLLWGVAPLIATFAAISNGVRLAVLPVFMAGFGPLVIFVFSLFNKKAYWKIEKFDYICGLFSILALIFWGVTKEPLVAIVFAILSDFFAGIITVKKAWLYPETEIYIPYLTSLFSCLMGFFAITAWVPSQYLFTIYLIFMDGFVLFAINRKFFLNYFKKFKRE